jgi:hypothetical protein
MHYDTTKQVAVYGFGGQPRGSREVSHCFPVNGNPAAVRQPTAFHALLFL